MQNQTNSLKGEFKNEIQSTMKTQQTVLMEQQNAFQNNLHNMLSGFLQNQSSTLGTLPSNTIPNPKDEMKAITIQSDVASEGPSIPTPKKVAEQETEETTNKEQSKFQGIIPILEPNVPKTLPKPNIPYPSKLIDQKLREKARNQMEKFFQIFQDLHFDISFANALLLMPKFASTIKSLLANKDKLLELAKISLNEINDQKLREKATNQMEKFFQIFRDLHFDISFADALLLMPKFASMIKNLLKNKDKLFELAKIPLNENCSAMLLKKLPEKLRDPGKFLIPCVFPRMDTTRYSSTYDDLSVNRIDIIDVAREEYAQEILDFSKNSSGDNPTSTSKPIISYSSPSLTPFEGSDFILEETEAYLKDESIST
nr:reverse transcriptase domain-containing protein [Tanacetum cinerariifolium]